MEAGGTVGSPQKPRRKSERGRDVYEQGLLGLVGLAGLCTGWGGGGQGARHLFPITHALAHHSSFTGSTCLLEPGPGGMPEFQFYFILFTQEVLILFLLP